MFSKMVQLLQEGKMPPAGHLEGLLKAALVKKQGVLQQPPACWSTDPKINPDAKHLLWAAALLGRAGEIHTAAGIMMNEIISRPGLLEAGQELITVHEQLREIAGLAPSDEFASRLLEKAEKAWKIISANNTE